MLINVKMPTIVGILTFMSRMKFCAQLSWVWKKAYNLNRAGLKPSLLAYINHGSSGRLWITFKWLVTQVTSAWTLKGSFCITVLHTLLFSCLFLCPQRNFGRHIVIALSVRPSVPLSCPVHISYILWGRNSKFGVWIHLGMAECRVPFSGHCDLDLDLWPSF